MCHSHRRPRGARPANTQSLRASDQEREQTASTLQTAAAEGRLTVTELEERLQTTWAARTRGELTHVISDLAR